MLIRIVTPEQPLPKSTLTGSSCVRVDLPSYALQFEPRLILFLNRLRVSDIRVEPCAGTDEADCPLKIDSDHLHRLRCAVRPGSSDRLRSRLRTPGEPRCLSPPPVRPWPVGLVSCPRPRPVSRSPGERGRIHRTASASRKRGDRQQHR